MVWFQCEDCGENLKKPKLPNHFRMCSAHKLSCIDCGQMFNQESVQSHTQCITEAEKYGPKGQGKVSHSGQNKPDKPKQYSDVDVNVGLSSRPPWHCSLCNTSATSKQTLLLHAEGKKHRAKARAFHAAQKQSDQTEEQTQKEDVVSNEKKIETVETNGLGNKVQGRDSENDLNAPITAGEKDSRTKKRKLETSSDRLKKKVDGKNASDVNNGEVIQAEQSESSHRKSMKKKGADETLNCENQADEQSINVAAVQSKIKWKKLVTSILKSSDGVMKLKKLQKLVIRSLKESGVTEKDEQLGDKLMQKIGSSSRFSIDKKRIHLVKSEES